MSHRTYGETKNCKGCRYWSEMLARYEGGPMQAVCLSGGEMNGKWKSENQTCSAWASGHDGAIDEPGSDPQRYENGGAA